MTNPNSLSQTVSQRYSRQIVLPEIDEVGQQKLSQSSVLCVGAGGLGSPALLYLAAAGIGHIGIIDGDVVDESNLQRQVLFKTHMVDTSKSEQAKQTLCDLNPHIKITAYTDMLSDKNLGDIFPHYDIILDGTDNFNAKFLINDGAVKYQKPLIYGAIQGFDGQVSVFNAYADTPCYRCLYPEPPTGKVKNCAEAGVIGAVAGLVGVTQSLQAIQLIVTHDSFSPLVGKVWILDTKTMHTRTLTLSKNPDCPVCSKDPKDIKLHYTAPVCTVSDTISPADAQKLPDTTVFIDVREQDEWDSGHIPHAMHYPLSDLENGVIPPMTPNTHIVVYCHRQPRSEHAFNILQQHGFSNMHILTGGMVAWIQQGYTHI